MVRTRFFAIVSIENNSWQIRWLFQFQLFKVSNPKSKIFENFRSLFRILFMNLKFFFCSLFLAFDSVPFAYTICQLTIERNVYIKFCLLWLSTNQFSLSLTVCTLFWFLEYEKRKLNIVRLDDFSGSAVCRIEPRAIHATCNTSLNNGWIRTIHCLGRTKQKKKIGTLSIINRRKKMPFTLVAIILGWESGGWFFFSQIVGILWLLHPSAQFNLFFTMTEQAIITRFFFILGTSKLNTQQI